MAFQKGALTEQFRRRRRGLILGGSLSPTQEFNHPLSGARLVMAKIDRKPYPVQGRYVVGWVSQGEECLWFYRNVETEKQARLLFNGCQETGPPAHDDFYDDPQVNKVYNWQDNFQFHSPQLTLPQMKKITGTLARIFNLKAPTVEYIKMEKPPCDAEALLDKNKIKMYRPFLSMLLHEYAHIVSEHVNGDKWEWHGPGFMRTYLALAGLFPEVAGKQDIEQLADVYKIRIAAEKDVPACGILKEWRQRQHQAEDPKTMPSLM